MAKYSAQQLLQWTQAALEHAGASPAQAAATARALVAAQAQGLASHGLSRVGMYVSHLQTQRVLGQAQPQVIREKSAAVLIDAGNGFAFPACDMAIAQLLQRTPQCGIAIAAITNSHHFGVAAQHLLPLAKAGLVGLAFGNSPAAMPAAGGRRALFGTNPIAAVFPRPGYEPIAIDLSLSEVARGKLMVAAQKGEAIPLGWALDADGQPTTDAAKGLQGSMLAFGGVKGAMLALMVELLVTSLTGAHFGAEADSFFEREGNQPRLGQAFIAIDPGALAGHEAYGERVESLVNAMLQDEQVRLPGGRRFALETLARQDGIEVGDELVASLRKLLPA